MPLSTEIGFNRTEKIISDLTDYCPTFGPLSPNNENKFDLEAVLDNLQDQTTDSCVVPNQLVLDNANVSTNNIYDKTNLKLINAIAFLATPSSSPFIGTPDLPSHIRQIILNDIESEPTESLDILPQMLGTDSNIIDNSHPAAEWNMVSTNSNHDSSSSSSTSSSSTLQINLKAVNQLTEVNDNMNKKLDTLNSTVDSSVSNDWSSLCYPPSQG